MNKKYIITKSSYTGKWIICLIFRNLVENDERGARHGQYSSKRAATEAAKAIRLNTEVA